MSAMTKPLNEQTMAESLDTLERVLIKMADDL